jgi:hypothetical protein
MIRRRCISSLIIWTLGSLANSEYIRNHGLDIGTSTIPHAQAAAWALSLEL